MDMHLAEAIAILITRILGLGMIDRFMGIPSGFQRIINSVCISINERTGLGRLTKEGLSGRLLDIGNHPYDNFPTALNHAKNRRFFFL